MRNLQEYRTVYGAILDALDTNERERSELINAAVKAFFLTNEELSDTRTNGRLNIIRSTAGTVINEMEKRGIITLSDNLYKRTAEKPVAVVLERCEEQVLRLLQDGARTKADIKGSLVKYFKTDKTETARDDNQLSSYMGQVLKRFVSENLIDFDGAKYSIKPQRSAQIKDRHEMALLKADFLSLVHDRGGEFFENYFMNLLEKYLIRSGKTVTESYVTGGSADGGIDGIAKTVDSLGFRETIMVQTKNRRDITSETDIRGFYGAVCAAQGSRGIYAITSKFHPMAEKFLNSIDNCVGIDGEKLFSMATDTSYGIRREGTRLLIDESVFD